MTASSLTSHFHISPTGTKTHYLAGGNPLGSLIICLHGLGGSTETFVPLVPHLPQTHRIVLVDFQGFGRTALADPSKRLSIAGHVGDLGDLIAHVRATPGPKPESKVVIIGHSLGAIVALQYAAHNPELVGGLALLGAGRAAGHIPAARERMLGLASSVRAKGVAVAADGAALGNFYEDTAARKADPAAREAVRRAVGASDAEGYAQTCEAIVDVAHVDPDYSKILCPAVFIAGDKDMISPVDRSQGLSELVCGKSWVELVKSGHQPILEDLPGVNEAIRKLFVEVQI